MSGSNECSCLLCGGRVENELGPLYDTRFGAPGTYSIARCTACGLLQTVPRLDPAALAAMYERYYNFGGEVTAYTDLRERLYLSGLYRAWLALDGDITFSTVKGGGRLLDVGCNEGRGLLQFRRNGYMAEGLEPNPIAARRARRRGFVVTERDLCDFAAETPYDVVVLSNVLEHSLDPRAMLADVHRNLRGGGEVWISLPNAAGVWRDLFGKKWINWHVPYHITHFDGARLRRLLDEAGFEVFAYRNETPALWIVQSIIAAIHARPGQPTRRLRNPILLAVGMILVRLLLFPALWFLNRAGRGDCLVVRARKV